MTNVRMKTTDPKQYCLGQGPKSINQGLISNLIVVSTSSRNVSFNWSVRNFMVITSEVIFHVGSLYSPKKDQVICIINPLPVFLREGDLA